MAEDRDITEPIFPNVAIFVAEWLGKAYARSLGHTHTWCPEWWQHFEAMSRLDALWRAWEHLRQDGSLGMSVWWRDHADHHMTYLLDPDGPFRACRNNQHTEFPDEDLPNAALPPGVFEDEDGSAA